MDKVIPSPRGQLDPDRWHLLKDILGEALEKSSARERAALVTSLCANDAALLAEAQSLVQEAESFLQEPTDTLEDCAEHATAALWQNETPRTGWRIGAYVVVRELGRGGMGAVYLGARADGQFEKEVAIKVLKRGTDTEEVLRRFAAERHILARLDHPNIARLLDAGTTDDGLPYFVMEWVAGAPINRFVRDHNLSIAERLAMFLKVCAAVEVAHHNHVVHRDLKASNILVNAEGEPKLLDFGIAKLLSADQDVELTAAGQERLTPNCASPEQTDGRPITEASDVYALGALLYEMLSGQKPHKFSSAHPSREEIIRVIREEEPAVLSSVASAETARYLRGDLDAIVQFAMRKEPEMRYPNVAAFASDIRRHLAHEPVVARRGTAGYRARSLLARHRRATRLLAAAAILLLMAVVLTTWMRSTRNYSGNEAAELPIPPKSIAVLPFDSLGDNGSSSYFADGVQDNILTDLGRVGDLKVISRSGVAGYRGKTRNVKQIGRELGVANVLEGSVQISGDRVRINAQLIDARTDAQIWADHYDRKVEDIFALQSELAQTIVTQLKATLTSTEKAAITKRPTQDLQAYDLFLQARAAFFRIGIFDPKATWSEALEMLNRAVERDPDFALAYCLLNEIHLYKYRFGRDHLAEDLAAAKKAGETALRLQPELEEARLALARYYYYGLSDYRRALEQLSVIRTSGAHVAEFYTLASLVERRTSRWIDSVRDGERAVELDPQNLNLTANLMQTYNGLRRYADAERIADAAILRSPPEQVDRLWVLKSESAIAAGDLTRARVALEKLKTKEDMDYETANLWLYYLQRDFTSGKALIDQASDMTKTMPTFWITAGFLTQAVEGAEPARPAFETAKRLLLEALQRRPDNPELLSELAEAEAGLGSKEDALKAARRAVELMPESVDALVAPMCAISLAEVLARTGDGEAALSILQAWIKVPFGPTYGDLTHEPVWDDLRSDPRFEQLLIEAAQPPSL